MSHFSEYYQDQNKVDIIECHCNQSYIKSHKIQRHPTSVRRSGSVDEEWPGAPPRHDISRGEVGSSSVLEESTIRRPCF